MTFYQFWFDKSQEPRKQDTKYEDDNKDMAATAMSLKVNRIDIMRLGLSYFLGLFYFNVIAYIAYSTEKRQWSLGSKNRLRILRLKPILLQLGQAPSKKKSKGAESKV